MKPLFCIFCLLQASLASISDRHKNVSCRDASGPVLQKEQQTAWWLSQSKQILRLQPQKQWLSPKTLCWRHLKHSSKL